MLSQSCGTTSTARTSRNQIPEKKITTSNESLNSGNANASSQSPVENNPNTPVGTPPPQQDEENNETSGGLTPLKSGYVFPEQNWVTKEPNEVCTRSENLDQFINRVGGSGVIIKNGYLIKSWGNDQGGDWGSAVKPVFSTLLFSSIQQGKIASVDEKLSRWWPQLTGKDQDITWRHVANMISGYSRGENPGTAWAYNDIAIHLYYLSLFQKVHQTNDPNSVANVVFNSMQFQDGSLFKPHLQSYRLITTARDFARIGWLWMNKGRWKGKQIIEKKYFDNYMKVNVPKDLPRTTANGQDQLGIGTYGGGNNQTQYGPGIYGFNWWYNEGRIAFPDAPENIIQANGHENREVMTLFPSSGLIVAARANWGEYEMGTSSGNMNINLKLLAEACP